MNEEFTVSEVGQAYISEVERGLQSVGSADRIDMLDELRSHISQLETDGVSVEEALGSARIYADALIAASGVSVSNQLVIVNRFKRLPLLSRVAIVLVAVPLLGWGGFAVSILIQNQFVPTHSTVSTKFEEVVPNVVGENVAEALGLLQGSSIRMCNVSEFRGDALYDSIVTAQNPMQGTRIDNSVECVTVTAGMASSTSSTPTPSPSVTPTN